MNSDKDLVKFTLPWNISDEEIRGLTHNPSKIISHQFWTSHENAVLEWNAEIALNASDHRYVDFSLKYADGPSENVRFLSSACGIQANFSSPLASRRRYIELPRGDKYIQSIIHLKPNVYSLSIALEISLSSFNLSDSGHRFLDRPKGPKEMANVYNNIENSSSSHYSDVRLVSNEYDVFYCHKMVLSPQSKILDTMFRAAAKDTSDEIIICFCSLTTDDLRKLLECFYVGKIELKSSSRDQLSRIHDFSLQYGLEHLKLVTEMYLRILEYFGGSTPPDLQTVPIRQLTDFYDFAHENHMKCLKKFIEIQLWRRAPELDKSNLHLVRFATSASHSDALRSLKLRCFDVLAEKHLEPNGQTAEDMFGEGLSYSTYVRWAPRSCYGNTDEIRSRLSKEFAHFLCHRVQSTALASWV